MVLKYMGGAYLKLKLNNNLVYYFSFKYPIYFKSTKLGDYIHKGGFEYYFSLTYFRQATK